MKLQARSDARKIAGRTARVAAWASMIVAAGAIACFAATLNPVTISGNKLMLDGKEYVPHGIGYPDPIEQTLNSSRQGNFDNNHYLQLKNFGCTAHRMSIHPASVHSVGMDKAISIMEQSVTHAINNGMRTLVDWHPIGDPVRMNFSGFDWFRTNQSETETFWKRTAAKFKDDARVFGYELWNEPCHGPNGESSKDSWLALRDWHESLIDKIRAIDPDKPIVCSGYDWAYATQHVLDDPIRRPNVVYATHPYTMKSVPWDNYWGKIKEKYPVLNTEFGYDDGGQYGEQAYKGSGVYHIEIYNYMKAKKIGWFLWNFTPNTACNLITNWNYTLSTQGVYWKSKLWELQQPVTVQGFQIDRQGQSGSILNREDWLDNSGSPVTAYSLSGQVIRAFYGVSGFGAHRRGSGIFIVNSPLERANRLAIGR